GLQNYLYNMEEGNRLASDSRFDRAKSNVNGKSNISSYFNTSRILNLSGELLSTDLAKKLEKKKSVLRKLQAVYWQIGGGKEVFNNEINLIFDDGKVEEENKNETGSVPG